VAARERKAAADAQRRHNDQVELDAATQFALACSQRDEADARAAEQVRRLDALPDTRTERITTLLGITRGEVTRLRKLAAALEQNEQPPASTDGQASAAPEAPAEESSATSSTS
jgi:hypothetical protein